MTEYRIYLLSNPEKIEGLAINVMCDSDDDAIRQAAARLTEIGSLAEIWQGARLVRRLGFE